MHAVTQDRYGAPDVLTVQELEDPRPGPGELLVRVHASPVTKGDLRLRAADFPGVSALPGRLMMGVLRPRNPVPGSNFAGRVVAVGEGVSRFSVGDDLFGACDGAAHAELLVVPEDSAVARMPAGLSYAQAAAAPYGALTALIFLQDLGDLRAGERALILGAAGGVGRWAVQLAKHLGAHVTAVCSGEDAEGLRALGADAVIDYRREDFAARGERWDLVLDTPGVSSFGACRGALTAQGRFLTLHMGVGVVLRMAWTALTDGPRAIFGIVIGERRHAEELAALLGEGALRPVLDSRYPLAQIAGAHARVESGRARGEVVVMVGEEGSRAAAG